MAVNILYISYWGASEGITMATVIPHLKILSSMPEVEQIVFCSIERDESQFLFEHNKVKHIPLISKKFRSTILTKIGDYLSFQKTLNRICSTTAMDKIICRSALAGIFGYRLWRKFNIPYIVESFEPHADYMIEANVWSKFGLRSFIQRRAEHLQKKTASFLFPVSSNYRQKLIREGVDDLRIITVPCCVSFDQFRFNKSLRTEIRMRLGIPEHGIVGIYIGKYGDIYHSVEAFELYRKAFVFFKDRFHLIILTSDTHINLEFELSSRNIPMQKVFIKKVPHNEISGYLSAADFAFSTIKPSPSRIYCSPIKNGEYWANGLPIFTEPGIGEDSDIILNEGGGILYDVQNPNHGFQLLADKYLRQDSACRSDAIERIAIKYRNFDLVVNAYKKMIS